MAATHVKVGGIGEQKLVLQQTTELIAQLDVRAFTSICPTKWNYERKELESCCGVDHARLIEDSNVACMPPANEARRQLNTARDCAVERLCNLSSKQ